MEYMLYILIPNMLLFWYFLQNMLVYMVVKNQKVTLINYKSLYDFYVDVLTFLP